MVDLPRRKFEQMKPECPEEVQRRDRFLAGFDGEPMLTGPALSLWQAVVIVLWLASMALAGYVGYMIGTERVF